MHMEREREGRGQSFIIAFSEISELSLLEGEAGVRVQKAKITRRVIPY